MTGYTWQLWNNYSSTTSATSSSGDCWRYWTDNGTSDGTSSMAWIGWTSSSTSSATTSYTSNNAWSSWQYTQRAVEIQPQISEEERQRHEQERIRLEEVARQKREEEDRQRKIAEEKALQLLLENLEENQAEIFKRTGAIPVVAKSGRKYSIRKGTSGNVDELNEKDAVWKRLCFHPADYNIPVYDVMLAQKLMLENCEEEARKIANFS